MDENSAWNLFESTGKVTDYLAYNNIASKSSNYAGCVKPTESYINADKNNGSDNQTTQYR